jgi:hypothetical protein
VYSVFLRNCKKFSGIPCLGIWRNSTEFHDF